MQIAAAVWGGLPGGRQTVGRGELYALYTAIRGADGHINYVTDNGNVCEGWHAGKAHYPEGED
eukprot:8783689-Pyramimonas_sp.AAC.1